MNYTDKEMKNKMEKAKMIFLQEVTDRLPEVLEAMDNLSETGYDSEALKKLYKFSHTLKGSGETIGMFHISDPAAEMNAALKLIQSYGVKPERGILLFLRERLEEIVEETGYSNQAAPMNQAAYHFKEVMKVYIIDDDPTVTDLVQDALIEAGFRAMVFHDTESAQSQINMERPDLIILDIILSSENEGIDFCYKLRSNEYSRLIPIIFLSKKNKLNDKLRGFATGADDYIGKPFQVEELVARVQTLLSRLEINHNLILQDELTKAYNRRYLEQRLTEEAAKADRTKKPFSIAMLDIDFFKNINDRYGHSAGDEALILLVELLHKNLRASDIICRYGGEEFILLLPETGIEAAFDVLERLRLEINRKPFVLSNNTIAVEITVSMGIACYNGNGKSIEELIRTADLAMYHSKEVGRNFVSMAEGN